MNSFDIKTVETGACYHQDMLNTRRGYLPGNAGTLCEIDYIISEGAYFLVRLINGGTERVHYRHPVVLVNKES